MRAYDHAAKLEGWLQVPARVLATMVALAVSMAMAAGCDSSGEPALPRSASTSATSFASLLGRNDIAVPAEGRFVLVNIPAFELIALEDGRRVLRSRVIVGRPATPTPELLSSMYAVRFNPSWTPTPAMVRKEGARPVPPGPDNPLGQILFELDNDDLIYLHATNDRSLFDRSDRALSHGCVRVQQDRALAAWVLGKSENEVAQMMAAGATRTVPLSAPIPVLLAYHTRFPDEDGEVRTYPDIYGWRRQIARPPSEIAELAIPRGCRSPL
jgi:murein L,D-transpeptidase YcbB/YkuD